MNYTETIEYINSITWLGAKLGLERIKTLLGNIGNPQDGLKFIHIGGTNGKGSISAMLSSVLEQSGYKVGLFTSPYVNFFNERMQINNVPISDEELAKTATYIRPFAENLEDLPTEFELNTAIALKYFLDNKCDIVILEVGMGGELDSTNVIRNHELAIITAIGLDHVKELGGTIEAIAKTKAGIIKENSDVLVYQQAEAIENIFKKVCEDKKSIYHSPDFTKTIPIKLDIMLQTFEYENKIYSIPLVGTYQIYNTTMVLKAIEILNNKGWNISEKATSQGLSSTKWPGRFEVLRKDPVFIVDGAHNHHGIKATAKSIRDHFKDKKIIFLIGVMADKDIDNMLAEIIPLAKEFITVAPDNQRAMPSSDLANLIREKGVKATPCLSIEEGVMEAINRAGSEGIVCAVGSLYMIGDIRKCIK